MIFYGSGISESGVREDINDTLEFDITIRDDAKGEYMGRRVDA